MNWIFTPPAPSYLEVVDSTARFPVQRVFCVGRNYAEHAQEMGHSGREDPFFFCKPAQVILPIGSDGKGVMPYPSQTNNLQHEVELVVALAQGGRDLSTAQAAQAIYGYAVGLDMTRRDLQAQAKELGRPWELGKSFDAAAIIGPIAPTTQVLDSGDIRLYINDELRQQGNLNQMIWPVAEAIAFLSRYITLLPGDVLMTGTPAGVSTIHKGDQLRAEIDGFAPLHISVK